MILLFIYISLFVALAQNYENIFISESYSYETYPQYSTLNDGNIIPIVALGTFTPYRSIRNSGAIEQSVITAIEAGYRHIDTAPLYYDEGDIGNAIINVTSRGVVVREELFITTKLDLRVNDTDGVVSSLRSSLLRLQLDYVDLFLIHFPVSLGTSVPYDILALWKGMEEAQKLGLTISIGVSNFNSTYINKVLTYGNIRPAVNQIEINPTFTSLELTAYCLRQGITVMSYAPFGFMVPRPFRNITLPPPAFNDPTLVNIAQKYGKTTKQVILRYLIDRGTIPIPQSTDTDHIEENIDVFDFSLTQEEVYVINEFNKNEKVYENDDVVEIKATYSPKLLLNDGNEMPLIGLGTFFPAKEFDLVTEAVITAFEVGYRSVDTSALYKTEEFIGRAIKNVTERGIVTREELFITSKLDNMNPEDVTKEIQASLRRLQLDYLDLYIIHNPINTYTGKTFDILAVWKEMEKVKYMGLTRSIGVSNFNSSHINYILAHGTVRPAINEIEVNPSDASLDQVAYCQKEGIAVVAYGPHGYSVPRPFTNTSLEPFFNSTLIVKLAEKYYKTPNQIILRYLIDRNITAIPKSGNKEHIKENFDIFDFSLSREEVYLIDEYDQGFGVYQYNLKAIDALLMYYYGINSEQLYASQGVNDNQ